MSSCGLLRETFCAAACSVELDSRSNIAQAQTGWPKDCGSLLSSNSDSKAAAKLLVTGAWIGLLAYRESMCANDIHNSKSGPGPYGLYNMLCVPQKGADITDQAAASMVAQVQLTCQKAPTLTLAQAVETVFRESLSHHGKP